MSKVEIGQKYIRIGSWANTIDSEKQCVVTGVADGRVSYVYDSGRKDYSSVEAFHTNTWSHPPQRANFQLVVERPEFEVGDYLALNTEDSIVWKVDWISESGTTAKALNTLDEEDVPDTVTLLDHVVENLVKASVEQIKAYDEHPCWNVLESSESSEGSDLKQKSALEFINSVLSSSVIVSVSVDNDATGGEICIRFEDKD